MSNEELRERLQAIGHLPWLVGQRHEARHGETVKWIPVAEVAARIRIGLSEAGFWVRANEKSVAEFKPGSPAIFLLPAIEVSVADLKRLLTAGLQAYGLDASIADNFPIAEIVTTALTSNSEYWTKLALEWIQQIPITPSVRAALQDVARNGPTQAIRHSALRRVRD